MENTSEKTRQRLREAVSGEAQAAVLYEYFAKKARQEGEERAALALEEAARNEKAHAEIFFHLLNCIHTTKENLNSAAAAEHAQFATAYPLYAADARNEGETETAALFDKIARIEEEHEALFTSLQKEIENRAQPKSPPETVWICLNCGHRHTGAAAPENCPVCGRPVGYFKPTVQN